MFNVIQSAGSAYLNVQLQAAKVTAGCCRRAVGSLAVRCDAVCQSASHTFESRLSEEAAAAADLLAGAMRC